MMDAISGIIVGLIIVAFVFGLIIGCLAECSKWRANADNVMRLYSRGRLYKVEYADVDTEPVAINPNTT